MSHRLPVADIQFISDFAVFARSKGDERYDYADTQNGVGGTFWDDGYGNFHDFPDGMPGALRLEPHTFSALADRLEALIADASQVMR